LGSTLELPHFSGSTDYDRAFERADSLMGEAIDTAHDVHAIDDQAQENLHNISDWGNQLIERTKQAFEHPERALAQELQAGIDALNSQIQQLEQDRAAAVHRGGNATGLDSWADADRQYKEIDQQLRRLYAERDRLSSALFLLPK